MTWARLLNVLLQSPTPLEELPEPPLRLPELVVGGILALLGIRSLVKWMGIRFESQSIRDQLLFVLHTAARVGLWFAFAGFFFGFALVDEVGTFVRWYAFVPLGLAGVQLMTGVFLARSPRPSQPEADGG